MWTGWNSTNPCPSAFSTVLHKCGPWALQAALSALSVFEIVAFALSQSGFRNQELEPLQFYVQPAFIARSVFYLRLFSEECCQTKNRPMTSLRSENSNIKQENDIHLSHLFARPQGPLCCFQCTPGRLVAIEQWRLHLRCMASGCPAASQVPQEMPILWEQRWVIGMLPRPRSICRNKNDKKDLEKIMRTD